MHRRAVPRRARQRPSWAPRTSDRAPAPAAARSRPGLQHGPAGGPGLGLRVRRRRLGRAPTSSAACAATSDYGLFFTISDIPQIAEPASGRKLTLLGRAGRPQRRRAGAAAQRRSSRPDRVPAIQTTKLPSPPTPARRRPRLSTRRSTGASGCDLVPFAPSIAVTPATTQRDARPGRRSTCTCRRPGPRRHRERARQGRGRHAAARPDAEPVGRQRPRGVQRRAVRQGHATTPVACPAASKVGTVVDHLAHAPRAAHRRGLRRPAARRQPLPHLRRRRRASAISREARGHGHARPGDRPAHDDVRRQPAAAVHRLQADVRRRPARGRSPRRSSCGAAKTTSSLTPWSGTRRRDADERVHGRRRRRGRGVRGRRRSRSASRPARQNSQAGAFTPVHASTSRATTASSTCRRSRCASRPACSACSRACRSAARPTPPPGPARRRAASAPRRPPPAPGSEPFALSGPGQPHRSLQGRAVRPVDRDPRDRRPVRPRHRRRARRDPRRPGRRAPDDRLRPAADDPPGHPAAPAQRHGRDRPRALHLQPDELLAARRSAAR